MRPNGGPDDWVQLEVAIGNTAIDGVAGLIEARAAAANEGDAGALVAELFEAVQYDSLDLVDDRADWQQLDRRRSPRRWFGSRPGGTVWRIVDAVPAGRADAATVPPPTTPGQAAWLDELNARQHAGNTRRRRRARGSATRPVGLWWKAGWSERLQPSAVEVIGSAGWNDAEEKRWRRRCRLPRRRCARMSSIWPASPQRFPATHGIRALSAAGVTQNPPPGGLPGRAGAAGQRVPALLASHRSGRRRVRPTAFQRSTARTGGRRRTAPWSAGCPGARSPASPPAVCTSAWPTSGRRRPDPWTGQLTPTCPAPFVEAFSSIRPTSRHWRPRSVEAPTWGSSRPSDSRSPTSTDSTDGAPSPIGLQNGSRAGRRSTSSGR